MRLFGRRETLHEKLLREAGLEAAAPDAPNPEPVAEPPVVTPEFLPRASDITPSAADFPVGVWLEPGFTGIARARPWDCFATVSAPDVRGTQVAFYALADGTLVVEQEKGDADLSPLADAIEKDLKPPYSAKAVRQSDDMWAVAALKANIVQLPEDVEGDEVELAVNDGEKTLTVDGRQRFGSVPALERLGEPEGASYVVRAKRVDGDLWDVQAVPL